jgi:hypothetical protein
LRIVQTEALWVALLGLRPRASVPFRS